MKAVPSYTKIWTIGSSYTENALVGEVVLQEKIDGSQFSFGLTEDNKIATRSKGVKFDTEAGIPVNKMFLTAHNYVTSRSFADIKPDSYFYCEYLEKPKHNVLNYERVPKNNLVLFDATVNGGWVTRDELIKYAEYFDIDVIPELDRGIKTTDDIKNLFTTKSYLGNEIIEGVVIKNYEQKMTIRNNVYPLFTKYVREEFKEKHSLDWKMRSPRLSLQDWINGFKNEARWQKAVIHLKEKGEFENGVRDIGKLIALIQSDIVEEESENIKNYLYKVFIEDIKRASIQQFVQWYKDKLLDNVNKTAVTDTCGSQSVKASLCKSEIR